jgi:hypothetical protein
MTYSSFSDELKARDEEIAKLKLQIESLKKNLQAVMEAGIQHCSEKNDALRLNDRLKKMLNDIRAMLYCPTADMEVRILRLIEGDETERPNDVAPQYGPAAAYLRAEAAKIPLGEGNVEKGFSSTYNALTFAAKTLEDATPLKRVEPVTNDTCENVRKDGGEVVGKFCSTFESSKYPAHSPTCQFFQK